MPALTFSKIQERLDLVKNGQKASFYLAESSWNSNKSMLDTVGLTFQKYSSPTGLIYIFKRDDAAPVVTPVTKAETTTPKAAAPKAAPTIPAVDNGKFTYVEPKEYALFKTIFDQTYANIWLTGHAGCGKDVMVHHIAEQSGKKVYQINCKADMSPDIFFGRYILEDGNMKFVPGAIEKAMVEGEILFINEAASMPAEVAIALNRLLEENETRTLVIDCDGGRVVKSAPGFKVILASNTIGRGFDENSAAYTAQTNELDGSIHSRISATIKMDFNDRFEEALIDCSLKSKDERKMLKTFIGSLRDSFKKGSMTMPFSTRNLISIIKLTDCGIGLQMALQVAYYNRLKFEEAGVVNEIALATMGPDYCVK